MAVWKIRPDYVERSKPAYCLDRPDGNLWQWDVYHAAHSLSVVHNSRWLIDLGCGCGEKAMQLFHDPKYPGSICADIHYAGYDCGSNIEYCRETYPSADRLLWRETDLEKADFELPSTDAVIVCADVIEHLMNPQPLVDRLASLQRQVHGIVLSTPDRVLTHGADHVGPPPNAGHVREWSMPEFCDYLLSSGLAYRSARHIPCRKGDDRLITTMVIA